MFDGDSMYPALHDPVTASLTDPLVHFTVPVYPSIAVHSGCQVDMDCEL